MNKIYCYFLLDLRTIHRPKHNFFQLEMKINAFLVKSLTKQAKKCALGVIESLGDLFDIFYYKNASKFL